MQKDLTSALDVINTSISQQDGRIEEMAGVIKTLNGVVGSVATDVANSAAMGIELAKVGDRLIEKMEERLPEAEIIAALQASLDVTNASLSKAGGVLIQMEANLSNKKIVENDGVKTLEDKTWFDHTIDAALPVVKVAGGTIIGIAAWEGGRAVYDWATSSDEPIDI